MKRALVALGVAGVAVAPRAHAVEREHHLGIDAGGAMLVMSDKTDVGGGGGAHWAYGLSDSFNLMVEASWSLVAIERPIPCVTPKACSPKTWPETVGSADVGVGYIFDVLQWVPYAGLLAGGYLLTGGTLGTGGAVGTRGLPGVALALGLDYRFARNLALGFAFRQHMLVTDMATYPSFTQLFARLEYTWGW